MKLYISGPISGLERADYQARFQRAEDWLRKRAYDVVNPVKIEIGFDSCHCDPITSAILSPNSDPPGHEWGCYLKKDIIEMLKCDGIVMLGGWEKSAGAQLELQLSVRVGLAVKTWRCEGGSSGRCEQPSRVCEMARLVGL